ncbi:MAG: Rieske 2Fe-2S domain-containing protein, partial [bacterium]
MNATSSTSFVKVGKAAEIPPGSVKIIAVAGRMIAFCNVGGDLFAVEDRCSHDDGPLGEGALDGFAIECPRHGARF